jgi:hypothetical protein
VKVGDHITDLEGHDLGAHGAVVVRIDGERMTLSILDSDKQITVDLPEDDQVAVHVDFDAIEPSPGIVDLDAIDSDELNNIRSLPLWWGPRDPNYPSTLTQVMWEPSPLWRRMDKRVWAGYEEEPVRYIPIEAAVGRGRRSGYKSKKKLYEFLDAQGAPYKKSGDETYGRKSMIYISWPDYETRREWEAILSDNGFRVHRSYWPNSPVSEIQVSYFKGWHWDE